LTVGILEGGVTPREELEKVADLVVDSTRDLILLIANPDWERDLPE
jgi:hypothetical protein